MTANREAALSRILSALVQERAVTWPDWREVAIPGNQYASTGELTVVDSGTDEDDVPARYAVITSPGQRGVGGEQDEPGIARLIPDDYDTFPPVKVGWVRGRRLSALFDRLPGDGWALVGDFWCLYPGDGEAGYIARLGLYMEPEGFTSVRWMMPQSGAPALTGRGFASLAVALKGAE